MNDLIASTRILSNFARTYHPSDKIDPDTGARKLIADTITTLPGEWIVDVPDEEAARLLRLGAVRQPTPEEQQLRALANGGRHVA